MGHIFPRDISPKLKVIAQMAFVLAHDYVGLAG